MIRIGLFISLFCLVSCSSGAKKKSELVREEWKGHSTQGLEKHYYFKNLPLTKKKYDDGLETWIYRDQGHYQSSAYCQSLGGCMGMPFYNCDNVFSVKDGIIQGFDQNGSCPPVGTFKVEKN